MQGEGARAVPSRIETRDGHHFAALDRKLSVRHQYRAISHGNVISMMRKLRLVGLQLQAMQLETLCRNAPNLENRRRTSQQRVARSGSIVLGRWLRALLYPPPPRFRGGAVSALRRVAPLPLLLLLLGVLAFLVLLPSDTAQAQEPPASSGETSGYSGDPTPPPENRVPVDWPLIPSGLGPGDSFRLLFLTSTKRNAASGDIQDYIDFVTARAAAGHDAIKPYAGDFRPVISTDAPSDIHAVSVISYYAENPSNGPGRVPVYWLNGAKVADISWDFFDNSWDNHDPRNELGHSLPSASDLLEDRRAWTGSNHEGYREFAAGNNKPNEGIRTGVLRSGDEIRGDTRPREQQHRLYAMSLVFTVDHTRARATFGVVERKIDKAAADNGTSSQPTYNPRYLTGPAVVYPGNTYTYTFTHNSLKMSYKCSACGGTKLRGASTRAWIGLISGTGEVSGNSGRDSDDAAWLSTDTEVAVAQADDSVLVGRNSVSYRTGSIHRSESHGMSVYIPNNAPRGSTFHIAFVYDDGSVDTRSGLGDRGWGTRGAEQVELGTVGTVTVAPVPDQPAKPTVAWGPTRNSVRIEFDANDHDGSDFIGQLRDPGEPTPGREQLDRVGDGRQRGPRRGHPDQGR